MKANKLLIMQTRQSGDFSRQLMNNCVHFDMSQPIDRYIFGYEIYNLKVLNPTPMKTRFTYHHLFSNLMNYPFKMFALTAILIMMFLSSSAQTNYYYSGSGRLNQTSSWGTNTDGSGSNPARFTDNNQVFQIRNTTSVTVSYNWTVSGSGSKVILGNSALPAITLTHSSGDIDCTLDIATSSSGSNTYSVSVSTSNKVATLGALSSGSTVEYSRTNRQDVQTASYSNLTLSGSNTKTAAEVFSVSGVLTINSGVTLDMTTLTLSGEYTTSGSGTLQTQALSGAFTAGKSYTFDVEYNASGNQTIVSGNYNNLNATGGNRTLSSSGTIAVSGTFTKGSGTYTVTGSTFSFNGAAQTIPAFTFNNLTIDGSGTKTASGNVTINGLLTINSGTTLDMSTNLLSGAAITTSGSGSFKTQNTTSSPIPASISWVPSVSYNSSSAQTIVAGNYTSLDASGGNRTLSSSGSIKISATFTKGAGSYTVTSSTVEFNGSTAQNIPAFTFNNLTINNSAGVALSGDVTVSGILAFTSGDFDIGSSTLTISGTLSGTSSFKGSSSATISISGSGSLGGDVNMLQTSSATRTLANLTLNRTSCTLTIGNAMELTGVLTLSNGTLSTGGNLTLISTSSSTARVAAITGSGDITGNVTVQRNVPAVARRFRTLSPNTTSFNFTDLIDDIFVTGTGGASNGFDASTTNQNSVYTYQESTSGSGRGWKAIANINTSLSAGNGALVFVRGNRSLPSPDWYTQNNAAYPSSGGFPSQNETTIDFIGNLNKGSISPTLSYTDTRDATNDGWNLVGNPYASPIDWRSLTKTNLGSFYYTYDPSTGSYVANSGSNMIASGQAFFVQATAASPSLTFTESSKTATAPVSYFKTAAQVLEVKMIKDASNSDVAWLEFRNNAYRGYNAEEDAIKFMNSMVNVGFMIDSANIKLQYSTVPMIVSQTDTFRMFASASAGNYQMVFNGVQNIDNQFGVYLYDAFRQQVVDLRSVSSYSFSISSAPASSADGRFSIVLANATLPVQFSGFEAHITPDNKSVELKWSTASEINSDRFAIERSLIDANHFSEIGSVSAAGNSSSLLQYYYNDVNAMELIKSGGNIFYRIKELDKDGTSHYSNVVSVESKGVKNSDVIVFPNPASDQIQVKFASAVVGNITYDVFDMSGRLITSGNTNGEAAKVSVYDLATGIYVIRFSGGSIAKPVSAKFTKIESRGAKKKQAIKK